MAIKLGGKPATRTTRKSTAKTTSAPKRSGRAASKPATRRSAPKAAAKTAPQSNRRPTTKDEKVINAYVKRLTKVGEQYKDAQEAHKEAVQAVYEAAQEAMAEGVPTGVICDTLDMSRQWLYKMGDHAGRNGSGSKAKAKVATRKTASKGGSTRPRIRTR